MTNNFEGKKISWSQYEDFRNLHLKAVQPFVFFYDTKQIDQSQFESKLAKSFY